MATQTNDRQISMFGGLKNIRSSPYVRRKQMFVFALFLALAVIGIGATSCTVKLIGDYDSTIDTGVTDLQQKAELYFSKLQSDANTAYDQSFYDDINARLAVLKSRAVSLPKYSIISQQIGELKHQFDDFGKLDKGAKRPISSSLVTSAESAVAVSVESILKLEFALKRGSTISTPSTSLPTSKQAK